MTKQQSPRSTKLTARPLGNDANSTAVNSNKSTSIKATQPPPTKAKKRQVSADDKARRRQRIAQLIYELYRGRSDVRLECLRDEHPRAVYDSGPIAVSDIESLHLTNKKCFGTYLVLDDDTCWFAVVDFDDRADAPDALVRPKVKLVSKRLTELGLTPLVAHSQSGRGFHLAVFFSDPVPAFLPRAILRTVLKEAHLDGVEVFPKQDSMKGKKTGSAVRLPLFNKSRFVDPLNDFSTRKPIHALRSVARLSIQDLKDAAKRLGVDVSPGKRKSSPTVTAGTAALSDWVRELLDDESSSLARRWRGNASELRDRSRSGLVMAIACCLVRSYVPTYEIETTLRHWCEQNKYAKGERDDWIALTIDRAYDLVQDSQRKWRQSTSRVKPRRSIVNAGVTRKRRWRG